MKKAIVIVTIILCVVFIIGVIYIKGSHISFMPKTQSVVNNNNYSGYGTIDYAYEKFACLEYGLFNTKLIVTDKNSNCKTFYGIDSPFRIYNNEILYIKNSDLISMDIETANKTVLVENVEYFQLLNDSIIYETIGFPNDYKSIYIYDINLRTSRLIRKKTEMFHIYKQKLFVIDEENMLVEISLDDFSVREITGLDIKGYPFSVIMQGEKLIVNDSTNQFDIIDLNTKNIVSFPVSTEKYNNNRLSMICDDNSFYYSFQATKTDGSLVKNINNANNGLWCVNLETLEKEKILNQTFEQLYLYEDGLLLGTKDNDVFEIDIKNKRCIKIKGKRTYDDSAS